MSKAVILLAVLAVVASANYHTQPTPRDLEALVAGFNDHLAIATDEDFNKCAKVPFVVDLQKLLKDLNADKPNPVALVADVLAVYADYNKVKDACPALARTYDEFFSKFEKAVQEQPAFTALKIGANVARHPKQIKAAAAQINVDLHSENYYGAGENAGIVIELLLAGFI